MRFDITSFSLTLIVVLLCNYGGQAGNLLPEQTKNFDFENDLVHIKVTGNGNVPKYTLWAVSNPSVTYKLFFHSIFTGNDSNGDGMYQPSIDSKLKKKDGGGSVSLPSSSWNFSEVLNGSDGSANFNITSSSLGKDFEGVTLQLRNHVAAEATELKFDVVIQGFSFADLPESAMMVFVFSLSSESGSTSSQDGDTVNFGESGYFSSVPMAQDTNGDVNVGLWSESNSNSTEVYISYSAWSGDLVHDPTVGVQASPEVPEETTTSTADDGTKNQEDPTTQGNGVVDSSDTSTEAIGPALGAESQISNTPFPLYFSGLSLIIMPLIIRKRRI